GGLEAAGVPARGRADPTAGAGVHAGEPVRPARVGAIAVGAPVWVPVPDRHLHPTGAARARVLRAAVPVGRADRGPGRPQAGPARRRAADPRRVVRARPRCRGGGSRSGDRAGGPCHLAWRGRHRRAGAGRPGQTARSYPRRAPSGYRMTVSHAIEEPRREPSALRWDSPIALHAGQHHSHHVHSDVTVHADVTPGASAIAAPQYAAPEYAASDYAAAYAAPRTGRLARLVVRMAERSPRWLAPASIAVCFAGVASYVWVSNPTDGGAADIQTCLIKLTTGFDCPGCGG